MNNRSLFNPVILRRIPNVVTLVMLVALGVWGHRHHWRMPRFSEFRQPANALPPGARRDPESQSDHNLPAQTAATDNGAATLDSPGSQDVESVGRENEIAFPVIQFRS